MNKIILTVLLMLFIMQVSAQTIITGKVLDEAQKPISGVSVSYAKLNQKAILGFARTADDGTFKLEIKPIDGDSVTVVFNHMSYARKTESLPIKTANYTFSLEEEVREFEAIKIKQKPITTDKDTINYNVASFTSPQDRVIADIIKKLPGVEMEGDRILYQGKPIQRYMINNLDLMEGRYGLINNNLPADAVRRVQIVENNQPIKILDSLVFSDRASLNIELKKFTTTGAGKVGIGATPALWLGNLTPMTLNKDFQMINSFQTNNIGHDISQDFRPLYSGGRTFSSAPSYLSVSSVSTPGFDQRRWLDNKIFLGSTNLLKKLKNDIQIKANITYFDDIQSRKGVTSRQYFTSQEVIHNREEVNNSYRINSLNVGLLAEKNEKNIYLKNAFNFNKRWNTDVGNLLFNSDMPINQRRNYTDMVLMNSLSAKRFLGKQMVEIASNIEYHHTPQRLWVTPGQFDNILNGGQPSEEMVQNILYKSFRWDNSLGFTRRFKGLRLSPSFAVNYNYNDLDTYIEVDKEELSGDLYTNDTRNSVLETSANLGLGWENQSWKINGRTPISLSTYTLGKLPTEIRSTFNPSAGVTYIVNSKNEFNLSINGGNNFGGINNFYDGFIIGNFRNIQRYEARLLETKSLSNSVSYRFKNTLRASFANLIYDFGSSKRDYIFNTVLDSLGRSTTQISDQNSGNSSHRITGSASKFLTNIKTVVKLNASSSWSQSDYLVNAVMSKQRGFSYNTGLEIINTYFLKFSADYKITFGEINNRFAAGRNNKIVQSTQMLNLNYYPTTSNSFSINNAYYRNNIVGQQNQIFVDAKYRYTIKKWKTDLEFTAFNLLNNNKYLQQFSSNYEFIQSNFELRPRQFFISTNFRF